MSGKSFDISPSISEKGFGSTLEQSRAIKGDSTSLFALTRICEAYQMGSGLPTGPYAQGWDNFEFKERT